MLWQREVGWRIFLIKMSRILSLLEYAANSTKYDGDIGMFTYIESGQVYERSIGLRQKGGRSKPHKSTLNISGYFTVDIAIRFFWKNINRRSVTFSPKIVEMELFQSMLIY